MIELIIPFEETKYKHRGKKIYRHDSSRGGTFWAFFYMGEWYACDTLQSCRDLIERLEEGERFPTVHRKNGPLLQEE